MEYKVLDQFEINLSTLMIQLYRCMEGDYSLVFEMDGTYLVKKKPLKLIEEVSLKFGSTYQGRVESAKHLTKASSKIPILINPALPMIATPTHSPNNVDNTWVFMNHVKSFKGNKQNKTVDVLFTNEREVTLPVSNHIFKNQVAVSNTLLAMYKANEEKSQDAKTEFMIKNLLKEYMKHPSNETRGLISELMMQILKNSTVIENPKARL